MCFLDNKNIFTITIMKAKVLDQGLAFEGVLDENASLEELQKAFKTLKSKKSNGPYEMDFHAVTRGTSSGILIWLRFLNSIQSQIIYTRVPVWLVAQFSMIKGYFSNQSYVRDMMVPFFDTKNDRSLSKLMKLGSEIPIKNSYAGFEMPHIVIEGQSCEPDFLPEQYFSFISENYSSFEKIK